MTQATDNGWTIADARTAIRRRWAITGLQLSAAACCAALGLAILGFYWSGWTSVPVTVRFVVGVVVFGISPGLLIVGPLLSGRKHQVDLSDVVISVVTCSFSCNLALNVVLFALHWSLTDLARTYVFIQAGAYALWGVWSYVRGRKDVSAEPRTVIETSGMARAWWFLLASAAAVVYIAFVNGAPIANSEELVWLRKLVENPSVRYDNLSFRKGDPSTYLFVPFQIFTGGASVVAHMDLALTYSLFWAVTTALSLFVIATLAFMVFRRSEVAALVLLWMLAIAAFDPDTMIYGAGLVVPFPNRYGFAGGVLLPLILLLFWSVMRQPDVQVWRWALLVYVAVEMTFVHARETLLGMGTMAAAFAILASRPWRNRHQILRIATVIGITGIVLVAYKRVNLALAPDLDTYVGAMTRACRTALVRLMSDHSPLDLLTLAVPASTDVALNASSTVTLAFPSYKTMFVDTWNEPYLGRLYLLVAQIVLPIFALRARSVAELSLAVVLAALGVIASSGFLTLLLSAIVGNPEILIVYNVIALFSILVVCAVAYDAGAALIRWSNGWNLRLSLSVSSDKSWSKNLLQKLTLAPLAACLLAAIGSFFWADRIIAGRTSLSSAWISGLGHVLLAATIVAIVYRVRRLDLPLFAPAERTSPLAILTAGCLVAAIVMPAVRGTTVWSTNRFAPAYPSYRFTGSLFDDYPMLIAPASKKLDATPYPVEVIRFLRERVPPNQTLLASEALTLLQRVPHFTAILSNHGTIAPAYIVNASYLRDYSRSGTKYAIRPFLIDEDGIRVFRRMLWEFGVDVIVVDPAEHDDVRQALDRSPSLRTFLNPAFEKDGYVVYIVDRRQTRPDGAL